MSPRRVLMTADAVGGVWTYALDLARGLGDAGIDVTMAVLGPPPSPDQVREAQGLPRLSMVDTGLPLDWTATEPAALAETAAAVRGLARGARADLIHLNTPALAAETRFPVPVLGACHSCLATWWSAVKDGEMPSDFRWRTRAVWRGLANCDTLVAPTHSFADATARTYEVPRPFVVHNGRRAAARGEGPRDPVVVTTGRLWDEGKNMAVLDAAAGVSRAPVLAAGPLAGPGGERFEAHHLRLLGRLSADEVAARLSRAQIFASSALYEPFGLGVLEAAQAGCALVLSDIPSFRELWGEAAILVNPDRPRDFAAVFDELIADPDEARRLGQLAQARARRFTVEAMTRGVLGIYRQLCGAVQPARRQEAVA